MINKRTYSLLGCLATIIATTSLALSLLAYFIGYMEYLYYSFIWCIILLLTFLAWRTPPKSIENREHTSSSINDICGKLREVAELVSILYSMETSPTIGYATMFNKEDIIAKLMKYRDTVMNACSSKCTNLLDSIVNTSNTKNIEEFLKTLRECVLEHSCKPNIEYSTV